MTVAQHRGGSGEPLVLIHGFTGIWNIWQPIVPALEEHHDVLAVTLLGHCSGESFGDGVTPSVSALADGVERDMDAAGFETAHISGNSLGGWLAFELARRGRARSVVAIAPAGGWEHGSNEEKRLQRMFTMNHRALGLIGPRAEKLVRRPRLRALLLRDLASYPERVSPRAAAEILQGAWRCEAYMDLVAGIMRDGPPRDFDGLSCPTRIVWGTKDRILPVESYSERLRRMVPSADFVSLDGLGHVPMSDDPHAVARAILDVTTSRVETAEPAAR